MPALWCQPHWHEQHSPTRSVAYCGQGGLVRTLQRAKEVRKYGKAFCCHSVTVTATAIYRYMYPCVATVLHGALWHCSNSVNSLLVNTFTPRSYATTQVFTPPRPAMVAAPPHPDYYTTKTGCSLTTYRKCSWHPLISHHLVPLSTGNFLTPHLCLLLCTIYHITCINYNTKYVLREYVLWRNFFIVDMQIINISVT